MDEKEIDNIAREIVAYYLEFRKVLNTSDYWKKVFKFETLDCSCECDCGFSKELYYQCRVKIPDGGIYIDGNQVINEPISEIIMHWNNEVQYIAPHFKAVKEYEDDYELRALLKNKDGYNYYLEANTLTNLFFFHISYDKRKKIQDMVLSSVRKYLPKDAKFLDLREHGSNYEPNGSLFFLKFGI